MNRKNLIIIFSFFVVGVPLLVLRSGGNASSKVIEEKPLVIVVPSYNNSEWVEKNLDSIFGQKYTNYRVIYIDDCSSDNTYDCVKAYIDQHKLNDRITIVKNSYRKRPMANHFTACHMCKDCEIIVDLDGDDWFKHEYVLQKINQAYSDSNVWMTYGQYEVYPGRRIGVCRELPAFVHKNNVYREYEWVTSHLRTFYAWLFKRIPVKDFLYHGTWLPVSCDRSMMYALLEMAGEHSKFISDVLYVYNCATPFNEHKQYLLMQRYFTHVICLHQRSECVEKAPDLTKINNNPNVDMIIFSDDNPLLAQTVIEASQEKLRGVNHVNVVYHATTEGFKTAYKELKDRFKAVAFHEYQQGLASDFSSIVNKLLAQTDYVLFAHDGIIVKNDIDLQECVYAMKKTHAFGFYFLLGKNINKHQHIDRQLKFPSFIEIKEAISAWQFECGEYDWKKPQTLSLALYDVSKVKKTISHVTVDNPRELEELWAGMPFDMTNVGLMYNQSPALIVDSTLTQQSSLAQFKKGLKLDTSSMVSVANQSIHVSKEIPLIEMKCA